MSAYANNLTQPPFATSSSGPCSTTNLDAPSSSANAETPANANSSTATADQQLPSSSNGEHDTLPTKTGCSHYVVVSEYSTAMLSAEVNRLIGDGYSPVGSMQVVVREFDIPPNNMNPQSNRDLQWRKGQMTMFCQPMFKRNI